MRTERPSGNRAGNEARFCGLKGCPFFTPDYLQINCVVWSPVRWPLLWAVVILEAKYNFINHERCQEKYNWHSPQPFLPIRVEKIQALEISK